MTRARLRPSSLAQLIGVAGLLTGALLASATSPASALTRPAAAPVSSVSAAPAAPAAPAVSPAPIAHDPTMVREGQWYYAVITGDIATHTYLPMKRSRDLVHWQELGPVFTTLPAWIPQALGTTPGDAWAPDLSWQGDHWALYYSASQFGTNNSVTGLATTKSLDPASPGYGWVDRGLVVRSTPGVDDVNAIDPDLFTDAKGKQWLAYGSFWDGIVMRAIDPATGKLSTTDTDVVRIASRGGASIEGPSIVRHGSYYYLFVAFDFCCRGVNSDYRVMVGRSTSVTGPYVDRAGVPMLQGGGTEVLRGYNEFVGTGGADIWSQGGRDLFVNHYYDGTDEGTPKLSVRPLTWSDGWPQVGDPVTPSRDIGHGDPYVKIVNRASVPGVVVEDNGCGYEGSNIGLWTDLGNQCQQWQLVDRGDGYSSLLNRFSNKVAEVAACDNRDGGNVAQWGWLGFLPNNDCQRWQVTTAQDGWSTIASKTPGARVMEAAACGTTAGTNIQIWTSLGNACQQFRFEPVGRVLLADPDVSGATLSVPGCATGGRNGSPVAMLPATGSVCQQWTFTSLGGADYSVTNARTGVHLVGDPVTHTAKVVRTPAGLDDGWHLGRSADGTWSLVEPDSGTTLRVRLAQP